MQIYEYSILRMELSYSNSDKLVDNLVKLLVRGKYKD